MAQSPYLSDDIKDYMRKFDIEKLINQSVNGLLKKRPDDPYAFLIGEFQKLAASDIEIVNMKGIQAIIGEGFPTIKVHCTVKYMNKETSFCVGQPFGILSDEGQIFDSDRCNGKGMHKAIQFLNSTVIPKIIGFKCAEQNDIDKQLENILKQNQNLGLYVINTISYLLSRIQSHVLSKPLYQVIAQTAQIKSNNCVDLVVNCLHGGKAIGSKCKVFKYMIIGNDVKDPYLAQNVLQAVRKNIVSGKGGEAALKLSPDGTFVCPLDTIMDNLKIVQEAINNAGAKDAFSIGLSWAADTLYTPETKKYELENPKTPFDNDQMIEYLVKLLVDKPIIQYLEDPLAVCEKVAWKKLIAKIKQTDSIKTVKVGSRNGGVFNLLDDGLKANISEVCIPVDAESHPDLEQEARNEKNEGKFSLDCVQCRLFELKTLSNAIKVVKQFEKVKTKVIFQDNAYETYDSSIIDVCMGLNAFSNLGSISKFDRVSKLARIAQINDLK